MTKRSPESPRKPRKPAQGYIPPGNKLNPVRDALRDAQPIKCQCCRSGKATTTVKAKTRTGNVKEYSVCHPCVKTLKLYDYDLYRVADMFWSRRPRRTSM